MSEPQSKDEAIKALAHRAACEMAQATMAFNSRLRDFDLKARLSMPSVLEMTVEDEFLEFSFLAALKNFK